MKGCPPLSLSQGSHLAHITSIQLEEETGKLRSRHHIEYLGTIVPRSAVATCLSLLHLF